ncbi:MAG: SDR family NAD(P)-dependent oxidoreductase [Acutalibacteraceae bacterium]
MIKCWFDYKTVIISGASSGMGKGLAMRLVKEHNCKVIGIARTESKLQKVKEELGEKGYLFSYYTFDVAEKEKWYELADTLKKEGIIPDMLINNAGILPRFDRFDHYNNEETEKAMQINFYSALYSLDALLPLVLRSDSSAVVNVASSAALCSLAGTSVYSASKGALKSFTDAIREEHRKDCYVGLVCPGFTKTDIFRSQGERGESTDKLLDIVSTDCDKMVDMIIKGIWKKKEDMIFGVDAHLMNIGYKTLGTRCCHIASKAIELVDMRMFRNVFRP